MFTRKGVIRVTETGRIALLTILDAGAEDAIEEDGETVVYTELKELAKVRSAIVSAGLTVVAADFAICLNISSN